MEEVSLIVSGLTNVWASERTMRQVLETLSKKEADAFALKLAGCASAGFWNLSVNIFRHEGARAGGHTWRFGYKNSSFFRVVGFVETDAMRDFIALDAFDKGDGEDYSKAQVLRMKEISQTKLQGTWLKKPTK